MFDDLINQIIAIITKSMTPIDAILFAVIGGLIWLLIRKEKTIDHKDKLLQKCYDDVKNNSVSLAELCETLQKIILTRR